MKLHPLNYNFFHSILKLHQEQPHTKCRVNVEKNKTLHYGATRLPPIPCRLTSALVCITGSRLTDWFHFSQKHVDSFGINVKRDLFN